MTSRRLDGAHSAVIENPLLVPVRHAYPTYAEGVSIDPGALNLLLLNLPQASALWTGGGGGPVRTGELSTELACIQDEVPSEDCRSEYVSMLLRRGIAFREPTEWEVEHMRTLLDELLAEEVSSADRETTLSVAVQAGLLSSAALFRDELRSGPEDGPQRLTNEQLVLALGRVLSSHPPGSLKTDYHGILTGDPDLSRREEGWLAAIVEAGAIADGESGSIQDSEVRRDLLRRYAGGIDGGRHDIYLDFYRRFTSPPYPAAASRHGEYWIAPEFRRFFRQWLHYDAATSSFKDTPAATSRYEDANRVNEGFQRLQSAVPSSSPEADLAQHLDDTIARWLVETHEGEGDFFELLLLGRRWHIPGTGDLWPHLCTENSDCPTMVDGERVYYQCSVLGDCRSTNPRAQAAGPLVFSVEGVTASSQGMRWVEVPAAERLGALTHPAWLAAHGGNFEDDASMIHRGKWIRENLFCQTVPPLSLVEVEAQLVPSEESLRARDRVHMSTEANPTCGTCHRLMNSLGAPFELYNHAGFFRADDHGRPPDGSTTIDNLPVVDGEDLNGAYATPFEFIEALARSRQARRGFIRHAFRYFMGRPESMADQCTLVEMEMALDETGSFVEMMGALVASDTFAYREEGAQ